MSIHDPREIPFCLAHAQACLWWVGLALQNLRRMLRGVAFKDNSSAAEVGENYGSAARCSVLPIYWNGVLRKQW